MTDKIRWSQDSSYNARWNNRTTILYRMLPDYIKTILEFGAGMCFTAGLVKANQTYTPSDLVNRDEYSRGGKTIVMDLNNDPWNIEGPYDAVMLSGLIEYVEDLPAFITNLSKITKVVVCSYANTTSEVQNEKHGWVNSHTQMELRHLFSDAGYDIVQRERWNGQMLYLFQSGYAH